MDDSTPPRPAPLRPAALSPTCPRRRGLRVLVLLARNRAGMRRALSCARSLRPLRSAPLRPAARLALARVGQAERYGGAKRGPEASRMQFKFYWRYKRPWQDSNLQSHSAISFTRIYALSIEPQGPYMEAGNGYKRRSKKLFTLLDWCVSSLRRGHANLLYIVLILTDDPRRESS